MLISDIFSKNIARPINGVVKAEQQDDEIVWQELEEYVVTKELNQHFRKLFRAYLSAIDNVTDPNVTSRMGVWISGFFGSGKSHFVKILSYLLENRSVQEPGTDNTKKAIDFFTDKIQDPLLLGDFKRVAQNSTDVVLFNIDSRADASEGRAAILLVLWRVFNELQGLCSQHPHIAELERHLMQKGTYEIFCDSFRDASGGDAWEEQRDSYHFYADEISSALNESLGMSQQAVEKWLDKAEDETSLTVEGFARRVREYLDSKGPKSRLVFLIDEMGQFIGKDTHLMLNLQTIVEDLGRLCNGRAWVIVTSQEDIDAVLGDIKGAKANDFSKIQGRFYTRLSLSSSDVAEVIRARLLDKVDIARHTLEILFTSKGDILKNQLSFTSDSATQRNYVDGKDFAANYPFVPYHFQLVQKIFESIRKAGATGLHLARGERSMLDAFQSAAKKVSEKEIGVLVPLYEFFPCIESFLDTAVKLSIDQAKGNAGLQPPFDIQLLQALFLIRYVDSITPNIENLITLCIDQVDADRITLKRNIEAALQRLERENLINRSGNLFFFLTNEEREISREIKKVDISATEENKLLGDILFEDILKGKTKHKYVDFHRDYPFNRICDEHLCGGSGSEDVSLEFVTPFHDQYSMYETPKCIFHVSEKEGCLLIKLPDSKELETELRTYLQTDKFIKLKSDAAASDTQKTILSNRATENRQRQKRLFSLLDDLVQKADYYALGNTLEIKAAKSTSAVDEGLNYIILNVFRKFSYLQQLHAEPLKEVKAVLLADELGRRQFELEFAREETTDIKEIRMYIELKIENNHPVLLNELIDHFARRPYGWPEWEIVLLVAKIFTGGLIHLLIDKVKTRAKDACATLSKSSQWKNVQIIKRKIPNPEALKNARNLGKELFGTICSEGADKLTAFLRKNLTGWLNALEKYKTLADTGNYPGNSEIDACLACIRSLLAISDTFECIKSFNAKKNELLDVAEDLNDLTDFYTSQINIWHILRKALAEYTPNKAALAKDDSAASALARLEEILAAPRPYAMLHEVNTLVTVVKTVNDTLVQDAREKALFAVDKKIAHVGKLLDAANASADLRNKALFDLQESRKSRQKDGNIPNIVYTTAGIEEIYETAVERIENAQDPITPKPPKKEVKTIHPATLSAKTYLETEEDVDEFLHTMKEAITKAIQDNKRVKIQ
ncbi:BREX system P-loop protein BrxC [Desulforhopalus vacuolatus]|uniref:BREX system P-loop protein BrxC n=1 Tax=Desulforhopalus vacuolatus TaxID=40414 RepID=UPI00196379B9|nr:BREX system P-loop protein BrxC [Desulforhopalus vacuolatus]MBM9518897.1 BREX system P-loop protein BrxC [Desulforhopalus vacuolatus]